EAVLDLAGEIRVHRADLRERAARETATEDEAGQRLAAADQAGARHHRVLAAHRAVVDDDAAVADAGRQPGGRPPGHGVEAQADRRAGGLGLDGLSEVRAVDDTDIGAERLELPEQRRAPYDVHRLDAA